MPEIRQGLRFQPVLRTLLEDGLTVRFRAGGRSMLPTIHDGDTLVVEPVNPASIRRGDVVVAEGPACVRAHRVVGDGHRGGGANQQSEQCKNCQCRPDHVNLQMIRPPGRPWEN